ncbi:protein phosphatase 1 [Calycina marina]|uniref:Protein phosphatase 1 n=1 Tax=Calycina marina TaxID=1763456 RepID=A0A9P8CDA0_9HELO|nr:protein phosphatase 1 [Calycina marina]
MRQILRPRTPTPSQRSSVQREQEPIQELEQARLLQEQKIAMIQAELDAGETHKQLVPLGVGQHVLSDGRKGSITTQDFLDEAKMIMLAIRGNARPNSGLASVEESESENDRRLSPGGRVVRIPSEDSEDTYQESTIEPFSRPPSREGAPLPRQNTKAQDPAVLDHLRKYAEINDMDGIVASSVRSIAMAREAAKNAKEIDRAASETISRAKSGRLIESDPPNIRIVESVEIQRKRKYSASTVETGHETPEFLSQSSTASTQSTASIPTGSSRGSDSRRVIPPHTVSHLIPQQVAGMVFDPENNIWRKTKTVVGADEAQATHSSDDEDPFGDIPDLSIDETKELHRLKAVAAERQKGELLAQNSSRSRCEGVHHDPEREEPTSSRNLSSRSRSSSAGSTTGPQETFSTSRSEQSDAQKRNLHHMAGAESETETRDFIHQTVKSTIRHHHGEVLEEFEKEISINEGRVKPTNQNRRRNVTITFSSPIASIRHMSPPMSPYRNDGESVQLEEIDQYEFDNLDECSEEDSVAVAKGRPPSHTSTPSKPHVASGKASRQISLSGHKFQKRPVSRIDEQEEEYTDNVEASRKTISVVIETPSQARKASVMVVATPRRPSHEVGTLTLTPMSDFTINQKESPFGLDVSYVAGGQRYVSGNNGGRTLSLSIKQLVEKITEIEPYEPYWESMKQIELKDKKLTSLHKLDEFCAELVKLDVSRNQISQLNGAPQTIRHLTITHNYLSDLTAWGHLANLQYVDVSNNELESLSVFSSLHHLRGLKADNNKINSLDGIGRLDSLLSLHVRGNMIESLDFAGCRLERLQELDLNANRIRTIRNIHLLKSLSTLNVETNELSSFSVDGSHKLDSLKYLRLNGNFLKSIDVSRLSNLRLLYLDQNRLGNITGLLKAKHLDSLSLREQRGGSAFNTSFLSQAVEIRKLFLSANVLDRFEPCAKFLNMQYLEIANCGLERLPKDFGFMFPNVRALNLSMNALRNIDGLVGISRLKTLYLAGNRVGVVGGTVDVLRKMESLRFVDLRNNQLNVGFYPPRLESQSMELTKVTTEAPVLDPFTLPKADEHWDKVYLSRLDMSTKMLRRIYEIMVIGGVKGLKTLDGLDVDRAALKVHDDVWEALVKVGIMKTEVTPSPPVAKDCYVQVRVQSPTREPTNSRHRVSAPTPEPRRPWRTES